MKITIEHYNHIVSYEVGIDDIGLDEVLGVIRDLLQADGYSLEGRTLVVEDEYKGEEIEDEIDETTLVFMDKIDNES